MAALDELAPEFGLPNNELSIFFFYAQVVAALDELAPEFGLPNNERSAHQVPLKEPEKSLKRASIAP